MDTEVTERVWLIQALSKAFGSYGAGLRKQTNPPVTVTLTDQARSHLLQCGIQEPEVPATTPGRMGTFPSSISFWKICDFFS
jgi:hypothetical protein